MCFIREMMRDHFQASILLSQQSDEYFRKIRLKRLSWMSLKAGIWRGTFHRFSLRSVDKQVIRCRCQTNLPFMFRSLLVKRNQLSKCGWIHWTKFIICRQWKRGDIRIQISHEFHQKESDWVSAQFPLNDICNKAS